VMLKRLPLPYLVTDGYFWEVLRRTGAAP
jgi:hypothetical protein